MHCARGVHMNDSTTQALCLQIITFNQLLTQNPRQHGLSGQTLDLQGLKV